jgi:nucleotidyltransferase/DNA polymerase involved in DNA repair
LAAAAYSLRTAVLLLLQVFVKPDFDKYKAAALEIREIFAQYDPRFRAGSLDEAYLDLTPHVTERLAAKRAAVQCAEATAAAARVQATAEMKAASKAAAAAARSQSKRQHSSRSPYAKSQSASSPYRNSGSSTASSSSGSSIGGAAVATAGDELAASSDHVAQQSASVVDSSTTQKHTSPTRHSSATTTAAAAGTPSTHGVAADVANSSSSPTRAAAKAVAAFVPEAFDLSELFAEAAVAVAEMRAAIKEKTALTASAGIAPNFMLAKVCADQRKPNGQFCLEPRADAVMDFLQTLPVRKVRLLTESLR